jgi:hypothetical protein
MTSPDATKVSAGTWPTPPRRTLAELVKAYAQALAYAQQAAAVGSPSGATRYSAEAKNFLAEIGDRVADLERDAQFGVELGRKVNAVVEAWNVNAPSVRRSASASLARALDALAESC